jgi:hypothetical protein
MAAKRKVWAIEYWNTDKNDWNTTQALFLLTKAMSAAKGLSELQSGNIVQYVKFTRQFFRGVGWPLGLREAVMLYCNRHTLRIRNTVNGDVLPAAIL